MAQDIKLRYEHKFKTWRRIVSLVSKDVAKSIAKSGQLVVIAGGGYYQDLVEGITIVGNGKPDDRNDIKVLRIGGSAIEIEHVLKLNEEQLRALRENKRIDLDIPFNGICFRGVTKDGAGIPEVAASIFLLSEDKTAKSIRDREIELKEDGRRPNIVYLDKDNAENLESADESTSDDELKNWLGEDVYNAFDNRESRLRFGKYGAWYNTRQVLQSDEHGYVVSEQLNLEHGKKYVIYLWGGSRNDLKPDARVEFTFDKAGTDLGAILLPDYESGQD